MVWQGKVGFIFMKSIKLIQIPRKFVTRCSSLPLLFSCSNAIKNPDRLTEVRVENGFEHLGSDVHAAIQHTVETGEIDLRKIEARHTPEDVDRAKELWANGLRVVQEARKDLRNLQFEVEVGFETEKFLVTGHVDVLDLQPSCAYVVDFKTGRTRDDHYHQMVGYAVGAWTKAGRPPAFTVHVAYVYLESGETTSFDLTVGDMAAWLKELDSLPERYTVNRRCIYCPLNNTCPAFRDYLKGSMELLLGVNALPQVRIRRLSDAQRAKLATSMKMAQIATGRIRDAIKEDALKNGEISLGNGDKFIIRTREYRTVLTSRALPVVARFVSARDIANATKLNLNDLLSAAAKRVKGPMRKVVREKLAKKLKDAGAIVVTATPYLETVVESNKCLTKKKTSREPSRPKHS